MTAGFSCRTGPPLGVRAHQETVAQGSCVLLDLAARRPAIEPLVLGDQPTGARAVGGPPILRVGYDLQEERGQLSKPGWNEGVFPVS